MYGKEKKQRTEIWLSSLFFTHITKKIHWMEEGIFLTAFGMGRLNTPNKDHQHIHHQPSYGDTCLSLLLKS